MKKKKYLIMLLQLGIILGSAIIFQSYVKKETQPIDVLVYNRNIEANTIITETDVVIKSIPSAAVDKEIVTDIENIIGKAVESNVYKNQYVYEKGLIDSTTVDIFNVIDLTKLRKISLPISYVEGLSGNVKRGDKVDLVYVGDGVKESEDSSDNAFIYSKAFLQDVLVYNVNTDEGYTFEDHSELRKADVNGEANDGEEITATTNSDEIAVITLAVTLAQAEEILARQMAGNIRIIGKFNESKTYDSLGYVIGDYSKIFTGNAHAETGSIK